MKIKPGQCNRCMEIISMVEDGGIRWVADMTPLDARTAVSALLAGRMLYRSTLGGKSLQAASGDVLRALGQNEPGERPIVVAEHGCPPGAARELRRAPVDREDPKCPKGRQNGAQGAARGRSVEAATLPRSSNPSCDACGHPCADGTYAAVHLGDLPIWAEHINDCTGGN